MSKDLKGREPGCLDHQRPTSLEGTNCVSSLTYSSTISSTLLSFAGDAFANISPHPRRCAVSVSFSFSFHLLSHLPLSVASPFHPQFPHLTLLFFTFRLARNSDPITYTSGFTVFHSFVDCLIYTDSLPHFFSLLRISPTNFHGRGGQFPYDGLKSPSRVYAYPPRSFPFKLGLVLT